MPDPSPLVLVSDNGGAFTSPGSSGINVTANHPITVKLASEAGVSSWSLSVFGVDDLSTTPVLTFAAGPPRTYSFTFPNATGRSVGLRSVVNGGVDVNGVQQPSYSTTFGIFTIAASGGRALFPGQTFESSPSSWIADVNVALRATATGATFGQDVSTIDASHQRVDGIKTVSVDAVSGKPIGSTLIYDGTSLHVSPLVTFDALSYGVKADWNGSSGTDDSASLLAADVAATAAKSSTTLRPQGATNVIRVGAGSGSAIDLRSNLVLQPGVVISPDAGVTINVYGAITAHVKQQIFDLSRGGVVVFKTSSPGGGVASRNRALGQSFSCPEWFGAKGDGLNDDTAAVQAAIDAVSENGGDVECRQGLYQCWGILWMWQYGTRLKGTLGTSLGDLGTVHTLNHGCQIRVTSPAFNAKIDTIAIDGGASVKAWNSNSSGLCMILGVGNPGSGFGGGLPSLMGNTPGYGPLHGSTSLSMSVRFTTPTVTTKPQSSAPMIGAAGSLSYHGAPTTQYGPPLPGQIYGRGEPYTVLKASPGGTNGAGGGTFTVSLLTQTDGKSAPVTYTCTVTGITWAQNHDYEWEFDFDCGAGGTGKLWVYVYDHGVVGTFASPATYQASVAVTSGVGTYVFQPQYCLLAVGTVGATNYFPFRRDDASVPGENSFCASIRICGNATNLAQSAVFNNSTTFTPTSGQYLPSGSIWTNTGLFHTNFDTTAPTGWPRKFGPLATDKIQQGTLAAGNCQAVACYTMRSTTANAIMPFQTIFDGGQIFNYAIEDFQQLSADIFLMNPWECNLKRLLLIFGWTWWAGQGINCTNDMTYNDVSSGDMLNAVSGTSEPFGFAVTSGGSVEIINTAEVHGGLVSVAVSHASFYGTGLLWMLAGQRMMLLLQDAELFRDLKVLLDNEPSTSTSPGVMCAALFSDTYNIECHLVEALVGFPVPLIVISDHFGSRSGTSTFTGTMKQTPPAPMFYVDPAAPVTPPATIDVTAFDISYISSFTNDPRWFVRHGQPLNCVLSSKTGVLADFAIGLARDVTFGPGATDDWVLSGLALPTYTTNAPLALAGGNPVLGNPAVRVVVTNDSGYTMALTSEDATSSAYDQIKTPDGSTVYVPTGRSIEVEPKAPGSLLSTPLVAGVGRYYYLAPIASIVQGADGASYMVTAATGDQQGGAIDGVNSVTVLTGGTTYTDGTYACGFTGGGTAVTRATGTYTIGSNGKVSYPLHLSTAGANYVGPADVALKFPSGSIAGAAGYFSTSGGTVLSTLRLTNPGSGGTPGTYNLDFTNGDIGGATPASASVVVSGGVVVSVTMLSQGSYSAAPSLDVSGIPHGGGSTATFATSLTYGVRGAWIANPGSGGTDGTYANVSASADAGGGTGMKCTVVVAGGQLASVAVTNPGSGYFRIGQPPTIAIPGSVVGGAIFFSPFSAGVPTVGTTYQDNHATLSCLGPNKWRVTKSLFGGAYLAEFN